MKKSIAALSIFISMSAFIESAQAYKFVIFTDEQSTNKSEQVIELFKTTYPFNGLDIEFEIVRVPAEKLECGPGKIIERLIECNNLKAIQDEAVSRKGDQAMVVKNLPTFGGSAGIGGGVPVITNEASPRVMMHEYLHTLGLCDEYEYDKKEAEIYCPENKGAPNTAFIIPLDSYGGDAEARAIHGGSIPWFSDILVTTPITNGSSLGTGSVNFNKKSAPNPTDTRMMIDAVTGLYKGKVCNNSVVKKVSWHPGGSATIMENSEAGLGGPLEKIVQKLMIGKGARLKLQLDEPQPEVSSNYESNAGSTVLAQAETPPQVDNSSRNIFKSFFGWLKDIIQSIGNALTR
jgi:hypothetical protein